MKKTKQSAPLTVLSIQEAASRLGILEWRVKQLVKTDPTFPIISYGKKTIRIIAEELPAWQMRHKGTYRD